MVAAAARPALAQQQPTYLSVERVRAALLRPPPKFVVVDRRQADFSVHIEERRPFEDLFDVPIWETPVLVRQAPSLLAPIEGVPHASPAFFQVSVDPTRIAKSAAKSARDRNTRTQVERAIVQYCAAQPDAGSSIPLCWSTTATP